MRSYYKLVHNKYLVHGAKKNQNWRIIKIKVPEIKIISWITVSPVKIQCILFIWLLAILSWISIYH